MYGIWIPNEPTGEIKRVLFNSPNEVFGTDSFTIIGSCIERNLVFIGLNGSIHPHTLSTSTGVNNRIPLALFKESVFENDCVKGPVIVIETDTSGEPIDIQINTIF